MSGDYLSQTKTSRRSQQSPERFPKGNEVWRNDLIEIIRQSRNENNWMPSKCSVICSDHFDDNDLYTTKGGLLRIATYAVPKKFLLEPPSVKEDQVAVVDGASEKVPLEVRVKNEEQSHESVLSAVPQKVLFGSVIKHEVEPTVSTISCISEEVPMDLIIKCEVQPVDSSLSSDAQEAPMDLFLKRDVQPAEQTLSRVPQEITTATEAAPDADSEKQSSLHTRILKANLTKKEFLLKTKNKQIKILNQKIRRLQRRNKSLKNILKSLKDNNHLDTDLFNRLSENTVAADLFIYYNRNKGKKLVEYTPAIKKFCLTLNHYSPEAYEYVRHTFITCLPHRNTVLKWYQQRKMLENKEPP